MQSTDRKRFLAAITACAETFGKPLSDAQLALWWKLLGGYEIDAVERGFHGHLMDPERGRFMPVPADIIHQVEIRSNDRPTADEAWSMVPRDEDTTAVLTRETMRAMAVAQPLLDEGDQVAARMAFKDAYARELRASKDRGETVTWTVSLGQDAAGRAGVIAQAVEMGRVKPEHALGYVTGEHREQLEQTLAIAKPVSAAITSSVRAAIARAA